MTLHPDPDPGPLEDNDHPIPRLDTLDTLVTFTKGASVGIVIATPLKDDERSRARLLRKFEVSLSYFRSADYFARCGAPQPAHSRLYVNIHSGSDAEMIELVERYCAEAAASGITPFITFEASTGGVPANNRWRGP